MGRSPIPGVDPGGSDADLGFSAEVPVAGPVLVLSGGQLMTVDSAAGTIGPEGTGRFTGLDVSGMRSIAGGSQDDALVGVDVTGRRLLRSPPRPIPSRSPPASTSSRRSSTRRAGRGPRTGTGRASSW